MEAVTVFTTNQEQSNALIAFLKAFKIGYTTKKPTLEELEARLLPKQREVWEGLKQGMKEAENGEAAAYSLDDLLNEMENENNTLAPVC